MGVKKTVTTILDKTGGRFGLVLLIQIAVMIIAPAVYGLAPRIPINIFYYGSLILALYYTGAGKKFLISFGVVSLFSFLINTFSFFQSFIILSNLALVIGFFIHPNRENMAELFSFSKRRGYYRCS